MDQGNRGSAQKLVGAGAEIGTALHAAVRGGHGEVVSDLVESGAPLNDKDSKCETPLHVAVRRGRTAMVELLLINGAAKDVFAENGRHHFIRQSKVDKICCPCSHGCRCGCQPPMREIQADGDVHSGFRRTCGHLESFHPIRGGRDFCRHLCMTQDMILRL